MSSTAKWPRLFLGFLVVALAAGLVWLAAPPDGEDGAHPDDTRAETAPAPLSVAPRVAGDASHAAPAEAGDPDGESGRWTARNNEATRMLEEGELEGAVLLFEECHAGVPGEDTFRRNLAEALIRLARREHDVDLAFEEAVVHLERAVALAPDREDAETLRLILARWKEEWQLAQTHTTELSLYFQVSYDPTREDILLHSQQAITFLDSAYLDMAEWFVADPVMSGRRSKIHVVLYNHAEFDSITGLGEWAGGVFDGTIRVSVEHLSAEAERWGRTLRHELVHAFVAEVGGNTVPGWLNEGLAQYLDTELQPNAHRTESVERARKMLRGGSLFTLAELSGSLAAWTDNAEITRAYAQSLALVDFIAHEYGTLALRRMLEGAKQGEGAAAAFLRFTGGISLDEVREFLRSDLAR